MNIIDIKQKYSIIGHHPLLNRAVEIATQVAPTDLNVVINGESGTGKEVFPQIIHAFSSRKHGPYIAVNCGAIPEGTIDSELFGHEKGAFTGATEARKGYFEVANGGTIFLDEVGELPLATQARLLRVLESGEYLRVGSSKVLKTDVRVVAATNINFFQAIEKLKFRADLYYRLNTVPVHLPPLRERKEDIPLLFKKFALDFAGKYRMPVLRLLPEAENVLQHYYWPGNIRQLKNITEQISIIENQREISAEVLRTYLPQFNSMHVPAIRPDVSQSGASSDIQDRDIILKILREYRTELNELKAVVYEWISKGSPIGNLKTDVVSASHGDAVLSIAPAIHRSSDIIEVEESLSLQDKEKDMILKALIKHKGKRKHAAHELGISERTLYRKINEYKIDE